MPGLTGDQRDAILRRYGGLVRTYFNRQELREARFSYRPRLNPVEVEFHAYLRLATVLRMGRQLPPILQRITLAPSVLQERRITNSRGKVEGRLDVRSYLKQRGKLTTPRAFPNWRVWSSYDSPENVLAAAAANTLFSELQNLSSRLPLEGTTEQETAKRIIGAVEEALRHPALARAWQSSPPDIASEKAEPLFARVAERWQTRRISNVAYGELWQWAAQYRRRGLSDDGVVVGLAYSEEFDNRLFEIFCLGCMRDAFRALGFDEKSIHPLHERTRQPILQVEHPASALAFRVHFQKGEGVVWSDVAPREWPDIAGVPDISFVPRSSTLPVIVLDAKNRYRGSDLEESIAEELYKILGYFQNFPHRLIIQNRGPIGGLIFLSAHGQAPIRRYRSRSVGYIVVCALDPLDEVGLIPDGARRFLEEVLRSVGLLGGPPEFARELQEVKEAAWVATVEGEPNEEVEDKVIERIHHIVAASYGMRNPAVLQASRVLEQHILGSVWDGIDEDVRSLLATAEVFWSEHQQSIGMDFAPIVVELGRAMEVLLSRLLVEPFSLWAVEQGQPAANTNLTLGQVRALIETAKSINTGGSTRRPEAVNMNRFLSQRNLLEYAYRVLLEEINFVNQLRRRAAHKEFITATQASELRERLLGVGTASPILARMVISLVPVQGRGTARF